MKRRLLIHGALFVAAALAAYLTWTSPEVDVTDQRRFLAWARDTIDVAAVRYVSPEKTMRIERRTDESGAFLWGVESGEGTLAGSYPVGAAGSTLVGRVASLRVIRLLGPLSAEDRAQYGLAHPASRIELEFSDERRELLLGDSVYGAQDRYAMDAESGVGYVLPGEIVRPLRSGEGALRERWIHDFRETDVGRVHATSPSGERVMLRSDEGDWTPRGGGLPDPTFDNFMQRVEQMAIDGFDSLPPPDSLAPMLRLEYFDDDGDAMGFLELARYDDGRGPYYVRSERTRIWARALAALAERVEEGLADLF